MPELTLRVPSGATIKLGCSDYSRDGNPYEMLLGNMQGGVEIKTSKGQQMEISGINDGERTALDTLFVSKFAYEGSAFSIAVNHIASRELALWNGGERVNGEDSNFVFHNVVASLYQLNEGIYGTRVEVRDNNFRVESSQDTVPIKPILVRDTEANGFTGNIREVGKISPKLEQQQKLYGTG